MSSKNKNKSKFSTKIAFAALGFILFVLITGKCMKLIKLMYLPWGNPDIKKADIWDDKYSSNFVLKNKESYSILNFSTNKEIKIMFIPDNLIVELPSGFGHWQLSSVYSLGENESKGYGYDLIKSAISSSFNIPVDGVLEFRGSEENNFESFVKEFKTVMDFGSLKNTKSSLSLIDLIRFKFALSDVRFDKISFFDIPDLDILDSEKLPDGTQVYVSNREKIESISNKFADPKIKEEYLGIAVFNATTTPLLGQKAGDLISNLGANVISVSSSKLNSKKTYVSGNKDTATYKRLLSIFDKGCSSDETCAKIPNDMFGSASARADIVLVLGEDILSK
jgi:hypothetical protein